MLAHRRSLTGLARFATIALLAVVFVACSSGGGDSSAVAREQGKTDTEARTEAGGEPQRVSYGAEISLTDYAIDGQIVVFDFMSDYCPPCQRIAPWMDRLHKERDDITVVKVDINRDGVRGIDWGSPVVRQYRIQSVPHFKVMNAEGKVLAEGESAQVMIMEWLQELPTPEG